MGVRPERSATTVLLVFVKICGITNEDDALMGAAMGADAIGLIFAPSTRQITKTLARDIVRRLPPEILTIGVFRNEAPARVVELANRIGLRAVQLHGRETAKDTVWIAERVPAVIRAFAAEDPALDHLDDFGPVQLLIDSAVPGSGKTFDWSLLAERRWDRPFILAGGLHPDNVADAIATVRPWGVDVASGVEAGPGRKDPVKLHRFVSNAVAAFEALPDPPDDLDALAADWMTSDAPPAATLDHDQPDTVAAGEPFDWKEDQTWH